MRVFLSYHTPDRTIALALKAAIEKALPGIDVFVDQTHLRHGHLWQPALFDGIAKSNAFLVLVSNRIGDWQKVEYYEARDRKAKDDTFVLLPVVVADRAKGPAANLPGLAQMHWIESTEPAAPEPLAKILAALQAKDLPKPAEPWRAINPYRGLVALEEQDADFFFGRDRETGDIINNMTAKPGRLVALVGNSGVGKSSLVQAGVIGAVKRQRWPGGAQAWPDTLKDSRAWAYLTMKPGDDPLGALVSEFTSLWFPDATDPQRIARREEWSRLLREGKGRIADLIEATDNRFRDALSLAPPPRLFLYIDQGEELYARARPEDRKCFSRIIADGLNSCPERLIVMTSQRADYYGELQANAALFPLAEKIDVPPLGPEALALVLREPAHLLGVTLESDDLVGHVVKSAEDQPGALPLLADLFTDLWERMQQRGDGVLRVSDRREIIQVGAALSMRANQFLARHPDKEEAVRRLFTLRLAHVPRQGEPVRARAEWDLSGLRRRSDDAEWALVEELAGPEWRLLVTGERDGRATAEVAHEVLLKTWSKLRLWLESQREFLVWRGEVSARRVDYEKVSTKGERHRADALLMGLPLHSAQSWLNERRADIDKVDQVFIEESIRADVARRDREQRDEVLRKALADKLDAQRNVLESHERLLDAQKKIVRRTRIGIALTSIMAVMSTALGVYALQQQSRAEVQYRIAQERAKLAEIGLKEASRQQNFLTVIESNPAGKRALQKTCGEAIAVTSQLADTSDQAKRGVLSDRFWELYFGSMIIVEVFERSRSGGNSAIEAAMVRFGRELQSMPDSTRLVPLAADVERTCSDFFSRR